MDAWAVAGAHLRPGMNSGRDEVTRGGSPPPSTQRLMRRVKRRFYAALVVLYRALFPTRIRWGANVPSSARRVLVVRNDRLGDMILTTTVLDLLRHLAPGVEIDVLASRRNRAVVASDPRVARLFTDGGGVADIWRLRRSLRARRYDAIFSLVPGGSLRRGFLAAMAACADTHRVSVWRAKRYHGFFTRVVRLPHSVRSAHTARQMSYVVRSAFGLGGSPSERSALDRPIRIAIPDTARREAEEYIASHALGPFLVVNLASTARVRCWSAAECSRLLPLLLDRYPTLSVVMVPGPADVADAERVCASVASPRVLVFDPRAPLLVVAALVARAIAMITPDTMTLHLAVGTGRPVVSLHTAVGNTPEQWMAVGVASRALVAREGQPVSSISAEEVAEAFDSLAHEVGLIRPAGAR